MVISIYQSLFQSTQNPWSIKSKIQKSQNDSSAAKYSNTIVMYHHRAENACIKAKRRNSNKVKCVSCGQGDL